MISFHSVKEFLTAFRVSDMFDADIDSLFYIAVSDNLINNNTDGGWCDVIHDTSASERNQNQET